MSGVQNLKYIDKEIFEETFKIFVKQKILLLVLLIVL